MTGMIIEVNNRQARLPVDELALRQQMTELLADEGFLTGEVSVAIVDDAEIHRLNWRHLQHDYPTDVLSFVLDRIDSHLQGEIIVSAEMAAARCEEFRWSPQGELALYWIHGALHLAGYNDKAAEDEVEMRRRERHYLARFGWLDERSSGASRRDP